MGIKLFILSVLLLLSACQSQHGGTRQSKPETFTSSYVDFEKFKEGRPCAEVKFMCLPESKDTVRWQKPLENGLDSLELTPQVMQKFKASIKAWNSQYHHYVKTHPNATREDIMLITSLDKDFFEKVEAKQFLKEMEQDLEKEFPGFWRDVPLEVRFRWIQRAMNKAKKFGYDPKQNNQMVELCARIGLDFEKDPKWDYITKFIALKEDNIGTANDYLDFTVFESDYSLQNGDKFTDWYLREAFPYLPKPKRPLPKLNN